MSNYLDHIKLPDGIKALDIQALNELSKEVRDYITITVLRSGGHLASSLGAVEMTVALLYSFDAANDRILFDVGHQCYAYKILTDRKDSFSKLRRHGGISGFPDPNESRYDKLVAGHAGTALAEGIGYAIADKLKGESHYNVSVLGDGVFANGLTLESLNNVNEFGKQIIILNDNRYSIEKTVGGYSKFFEKLRERVYDGTVDSEVFAHLDCDYIGVVDGHDISTLIDAFELAKTTSKSVIVHILTTKGKGYAPAEAEPIRNHSVGSDRGFSSYEGEAILKLAREDDKIVVVVAAMGEGNGLSDFVAEFPDRYIDVGIAEGLAVSVASGLARSGMKPIVCIYSTFIQRAYDQILIEAKGLPITYVLGRSGIVSGDGCTHQGIFAYQTFASSDVTVMYPSCVEEFEPMLRWCLAQNGPHALAIPKEEYYQNTFDTDYPHWQLVNGSGSADTCIFAVGAESLKNAMYVSEMLSYSDISVDIVNARVPSIIDGRFIGKYSKNYLVDESYTEGGFFDKISKYIHIDKAFVLTAVPSSATREEILFEQGMSKGKIYSYLKQELAGDDENEDR